jgi:hypothetical protein
MNILNPEKSSQEQISDILKAPESVNQMDKSKLQSTLKSLKSTNRDQVLKAIISKHLS